MWTHVAMPVVESVPSPVVQPKLTIGAPDDRYEREADRVADQVMRMPAVRSVPAIQRACAGCSEDDIQREPDHEDDEALMTKPKAGAAPSLNPAASAEIGALSGGRPLSTPERSFFEPRFGFDFGNVRVFDDTRAASAASSINARAFTHGHRIVLGSGAASTSHPSGQRLMAHELTHVIQQSRARPRDE